MPQIVQLTFPLPPTLNEQIRLARAHWSRSAQAKKIWTNKLSVMAYGTPGFPGKVWMGFEWQVKSYGNDQDNVAAASKYICDALVDAGVILRDNLNIIQSPVVHWYNRGKVDRVVVTISDTPDFLVNSVLAQYKNIAAVPKS